MDIVICTIISSMKLRLVIYFFLLPLWFHAQSSNTVGNATSIGDDCYLVTPSQDWQNGAVWFSDPLNLTEEFTIDLNINFGIYDSNGADGMVFVMQTVGTNLLGVSGGGLGYEGINPSLGVELDTWQNTDMGDPFQDHISIISDGNVNHSASTNLSGPVPASSSNSNIEDGQFHQFRLNWIPDINTLEVYFDCDLRISVEVDIMNDIFDGVTQVYWGFTGSTGGSNNNQSVCLNEFTLGLPETETICNGESIQMGVNGGEASSYLWIPNEGINDPTEQYPIFNPSVSTYYTVEYTDYCGETQFQNVNIDVTDFSIDIASEIDLCNNEAFLFEPDVPEGSVLLWNNEIESPTFTADEEGFVEVYGEYLGCSDVSSSMVAVNPLPAPLYPTENLVETCENEVVELNAYCDGCVYDWGGYDEPIYYSVNEAGVHTVEITNEYGCTSLFSYTIHVTSSPQITLDSLYQFCKGTAGVLSTGLNSTNMNVIWNTNDTTSMINVTETGAYSVYASNLCGSDETSTFVSFDECSCDIWAPTAFTPDNDGVNDVFVPIIRCDAVSYQLNIYNRWGEVVFYSTNQGEIWTGCVHNGDYFSRDGVYAWEVSYSSQSDQLILHQARGHVILIR
ncbi:gliding motility-associated C-terminal domain-containing protein [Flavobacteriales bacterium]|nr:gliding motility-associated C-terminal domain-containing protein [Flavobacteriales bacterium]